MPITFSCACGQQLEMADEYAGQQARCPSCQAVVAVPSGAPAPPPLPPAVPPKARLADPNVTDDDHGAGAASLDPRDRRNTPSSRRRRDEDDEEDEDRPRRRRRRYEDDDDDYEPRRRREPQRKLWNNRVTGGIVSIVLALVIFGVGLAVGRVCIWPIIMVIIGVVSIIQGLATGRDE
jgi:hypothetical protein